MPDDLDSRLKAAVSKREKLAAEAQRIAGRKEAAEKALEAVEQEIREKNLDPEDLDRTIEKLESALEAEVKKLEEGIAAAQADLSPYLENNKP